MGYIFDGNYFGRNNLNSDLDSLFVNLHEAYLGKRTFDWDIFKKLSFNYFDSLLSLDKEEKIEGQKRFLNNFNNIWNHFYLRGEYFKVEEIFIMILDLVFEWERLHWQEEEKIHKGGVYYFWGMNTIKNGDLEKGYALMHKALQEDIRTTEQKTPETPALWFATANYSRMNQAFREWPLRQANFLNERLNDYCSRYQRKLDLDRFRENFLCYPEISEVIYIFAFNISKLYLIHETIKTNNSRKIIYESDFAGQLFLDIFFNLTLVIDASIGIYFPNGKYFINRITDLSKCAALGMSIDQWRYVNKQIMKDFDSRILSILEGKFLLKNGRSLVGIIGDIGISYGIRNFVAHNVKTSNVIWENFDQIEQMLFNVIFFVYEVLYLN